ncbi:MAG: hypothetical protein AAF570_27170, partial [Bacteroidota bacterium]
MKHYDERIEALLLSHSFTELTPEEQAYVRQQLGEEAAYEAERTMRLRTRAILAAETPPSDPEGRAAVLARAGKKRPAIVIPLWQAAAAAAIAFLVAWFLRDATHTNSSGNPAPTVLTTIDTVFQPIKVKDTIYLTENNTVSSPEEKQQTVVPSPKRSPKKATPRRILPSKKKVNSTPAPSPKLAAAMAALPDPGATSRRV